MAAEKRCGQCFFYHLPEGVEKGLCWENQDDMKPTMGGNSACGKFKKKLPRRRSKRYKGKQVEMDV